MILLGEPYGASVFVVRLTSREISELKRRILILAANPRNTSRRRLDEEVREIDLGLQRAQRRDEFVLRQQWATRPQDVRRVMLDFSPNIVHFCGYGKGEAGIIFEDEAGQALLVSAEALAGFFELFADRVECVLLNACYSEIQAEAIAQHIDYVIGMKQQIDEKATIEFAVAFYDALGAGRSVEFAYRLACSAIEMMGVPEHLKPVMITRSRGGQLEKESAGEYLDHAAARQIVATPLKKWRVSVVVALRDVGDATHSLVGLLERNNFAVSLVSDVGTGPNRSKVFSKLATATEASDFTMVLVDNDKLEEIRSVIRENPSALMTTSVFVKLPEGGGDEDTSTTVSMSEVASGSQERRSVLSVHHFRNSDDLVSLAETVLKAFSQNICLQILGNQVRAVRSTRTVVGLMLSIGDIVDQGYYIDGPFTVESGLAGETISSLPDLLKQVRKRRSRILIRGAPGIGKSTALAKAFLSHAYEALQSREQDSVPVHVSLRGLGEQYHFSFEAYVQECCRDYLAKEAYPLFDSEMVNSVLYIDGFDEITEQYRKLDMQRVVTSDFFRNSVVLCSRKRFSDAVMTRSLAFASLFDTVITLDDWGNEAIWLYINRFCENQNAHDLPEELGRAYGSSIYSQSIFRNPLLLNMFLWVVKDSGMQLPLGVDDATSLFTEFVNRWAIRELLRYEAYDLPEVEADARTLIHSWYIAAWQIYRARLQSERISLEEIENSVRSQIPGSLRILSKPAFSNIFDVQRFTGNVLGMIHEQFVEYFVASLFVEGCLEAREPYPEYLQYGIRYQINAFIKGIWKGLTKDELLYSLDNLWRAFQESLESDSAEAVNTATNAIYYISRIPLPDMAIGKLRLAHELAETNEADLYIRNGILWGLVRLGDWQSEEKLYASFVTNEEADRLNRGLHLSYFGDCSEPSPYYDDGTHDWTLTLSGLLSHIEGNRPRLLYTRRIDIYIIRSLVESRKDTGPLIREHIRRIEESVKKLENTRNVANELFIHKVKQELGLLKAAWQKFGTK